HNHRRCTHALTSKLRADKHAHIPGRLQMKIANSVRFLTLAAVSMLLATACTSTRTQKSAGETIDDGVISTSVNTALVGDSLTKAHEINVETNHSVVVLAGFVGNDSSRSAAGDIARSISGVKKVDNQIAIK